MCEWDFFLTDSGADDLLNAKFLCFYVFFKETDILRCLSLLLFDLLEDLLVVPGFFL